MVSSNNNNNNNPLSLNISRVIRLEIDRKFHVFFVPVATPYIYTPVHSIRILISSCHRDTYTLSLSLSPLLPAREIVSAGVWPCVEA